MPENKQLILICTPPILCISMLLFMPFITDRMGKTEGYIIGFCMYWFVFCLPVSLYSSDGFVRLRRIYSQSSDISAVKRNIYCLLAFIPCIGAFFAVFKEIAPIAGLPVLVIALVVALINGTFEEMFWRGIFNDRFNNNIFFAYIYPTVFFGIWHIGVYLARGIIYQAGFTSLVGGSFAMGLLWGWVAYKTKSIQVVTAAHILTNFFAFTGLIYQNWFQ